MKTTNLKLTRIFTHCTPNSAVIRFYAGNSSFVTVSRYSNSADGKWTELAQVNWSAVGQVEPCEAQHFAEMLVLAAKTADVLNLISDPSRFDLKRQRFIAEANLKDVVIS